MGNWCLHASSSSKLLVTRTGIKAQSSSILGLIRPLILELLALERRKFHTFELDYLWSQFSNLDQILCVASLGWGKGCIRFWGRLTSAHWAQVSDRCPLGYLLLSSLWKKLELPIFAGRLLPSRLGYTGVIRVIMERCITELNKPLMDDFSLRSLHISRTWSLWFENIVERVVKLVLAFIF